MVAASKRPFKERLIGTFNTKTGIFVVLMVPLQILFFLILVFPFALEIFLSTTPWQPQFGDWWETSFIGVANYVKLLTKDIRFLMSLARTAVLVAATVSVEFILGLGLALLLAKAFPAKRIFFSVLTLPMMIMPIVVGYNFYLMFQATGPINYLIGLVMGTTVTWGWLSDPFLAYVAVFITDVWHWTPFMFLVLYAGVVSVPENPLHAARILGANTWQLFWRVRFPLMRNIVLIAVVIRGMEVMKLFDEIFVMTRGGPGYATETLSYYTFLQAMQYVRIGYSSAAAIIILIITVILIGFAVRPILRAGRE